MKINFENNWMSKSLDSLEKINTTSPSADDGSYLVRTCYKLRKKQLKDFEIEDLRILIGQDEGLKFLIPLAINQLKKDILAEGDYYEGDLLMAVLTSDKNFWQKNPEYKNEILTIIENQSEKIKNEDVSFEMKTEWYSKIEGFKKIYEN